MAGGMVRLLRPMFRGSPSAIIQPVHQPGIAGHAPGGFCGDGATVFQFGFSIPFHLALSVSMSVCTCTVKRSPLLVLSVLE